MSQTLKLYQRISKMPFGNWIFTKALTFKAPYFSTIRPLVVELKPGLCRAQVKDRRSIQNHLRSINAGALCTLAELVGGLSVEASLPSNLRWIPRGMTVNYTKMAKGKLTGISAFDPVILQPGDVQVPLKITDAAEDTVLDVVISFYISSRK